MPEEKIQENENKPDTRTPGQQRQAARKRNYATILYPESCAPNYREILTDTHIPTFISPLHDQDVNEGDGTPKKPHYHVLVMFDSPVDFEKDVAPIFRSIGAVGREKVSSKRGYARYLCHMDNPEKHQYDQKDVLALNGAKYQATIHLPSDDVNLLYDIMQFARFNCITSFAELCDLCFECKPDYFTVIVTSRGMIVREYLKSLQHEMDHAYKRHTGPLVDPKTGEVIGDVACDENDNKAVENDDDKTNENNSPDATIADGALPQTPTGLPLKGHPAPR